MTRTFLIVLLILPTLSFSYQRKKQPSQNPTNEPPVIAKFESSAPSITKCGDNPGDYTNCTTGDRKAVTLRVTASDPDGDALRYEYSATAGEIFGSGPSVSWRLGDQKNGEYTATVKVVDSKSAVVTSTVIVKVVDCQSCFVGLMPCPVLLVVAREKWSTD
jgi:hypothetical protein